jgi:Ni/Fe-hydrogenase subunit HybB-like protein
MRNRLGFWTALSGALIAGLLVISVIRFTQGLGSVSNLSDRFPWGLWIGFDLLCGVGLAAGGFAVTAAVYLFHLEDFRPITRPTILTAYLGYILVIVALLFDLGRPWNIWHPIIMWNPHSVMFEVGWCVMLYSTVLTLEFAPAVLEKFKLTKAVKILKRISPILVLLGVILSTLHQSSLGSLFLILPEKIHPLWYSPMLPVFFYVSAIAAGLGMTVVESWFSRRVFGKPLETHLLARLSRASVVVLAFFLALRFRDLVSRDALKYAFLPTREAAYFWAEIGIGAAIPMVLLFSAKFRESAKRLAAAQGLVVLGFILHRMNVSITSVEAMTGQHYSPAIPEFLLSMGLVAVGLWVFVLACRFFPVFPEGPMAEEPKALPREVPAHMGVPARTML